MRKIFIWTVILTNGRQMYNEFGFDTHDSEDVLRGKIVKFCLDEHPGYSMMGMKIAEIEQESLTRLGITLSD